MFGFSSIFFPSGRNLLLRSVEDKEWKMHLACKFVLTSAKLASGPGRKKLGGRHVGCREEEEAEGGSCFRRQEGEKQLCKEQFLQVYYCLRRSGPRGKKQAKKFFFYFAGPEGGRNRGDGEGIANERGASDEMSGE